jgi:hypothetical protein
LLSRAHPMLLRGSVPQATLQASLEILAVRGPPHDFSAAPSRSFCGSPPRQLWGTACCQGPPHDFSAAPSRILCGPPGNTGKNTCDQRPSSSVCARRSAPTCLAPTSYSAHTCLALPCVTLTCRSLTCSCARLWRARHVAYRHVTQLSATAWNAELQNADSESQ